MTTADAILVGALVALVVVLFGLALAEASLLRVRRSEVAVSAAAGDRQARRFLGLLDELPQVLNAVLLAVLFAQVAAATIAGVLARRWSGGVGIMIATVLVSLVLFVYGEAIPKTIAVGHPFVVGRRLAAPLHWLHTATRPIVSVLVRLADAQTPGSGITTISVVSEEELLHLADEAASAGRIDETDAELIERSFAFGDANVDQIHVPLSDVVAVGIDTRVDEALRVALAAGHRRLPIFDGSTASIVGFVRLRDVAHAVTTQPNQTVRDRALPVLTVRESEPITTVLRSMQRTGRHLAVVVDANDHTTGIVTVEDVVEELVGTIEDR